MTDTRTIQPDDLFGLYFLNGAQLSPDGDSILYYVNKINAEDDKEYATIYLNDRQMTNGKAQDITPEFSPDGKSIAFLSDRSGKVQLYQMPVDGGEAHQLTDLKQNLGGFAWSPDGSKIAFSAKPDFEGDDPIDLTKEPYRVTRKVYRFDAIGYLDQNVHNIYLLDVASGEVTQLTDDETDNVSLRWSPDGEKILYSASMQHNTARTIYPTLTVIDLDGKKQTLLKGWDTGGKASWLPDSEKIAFVGRPDDGAPIGTKSDLWVVDVESGDVEHRSAGLKVGVGGRLSLDMPAGGLANWQPLISSDGETAYVPVQTGGNVHIYAIALTDKASYQPLTSGDEAIFLCDIKDNSILYAKTTLNAPFELWRTNLTGSNPKQITHLNGEYLDQITLPQTEHLLWNSVDGEQVEGWYMKPPVGSAPYPTILYIHGGPHAAYGNGFHFDFQMLAGAGYGVLFLNHRASTGYGDGFSTAIKGDWGNLDYHDLMTGVNYAIEKGLADRDKLGVCGTSGGGNLSTWIIGQTDRFKAAIPQNPVTNWRSFYGTSDIGIYFATEQLGGHPHEIPEIYTKCSPITYAHNCTTPTLMVQSENDWRCPAEQSEQFYTVLKANGCTVEMLRQPGGSHGASIRGAVNLRRAHNDAMLDWFGKYVMAE